MIANACGYHRRNSGPARYYSCLRDQVAGLRRTPSLPDQSHLTAEQRRMIANACGITDGTLDPHDITRASETKWRITRRMSRKQSLDESSPAPTLDHPAPSPPADEGPTISATHQVQVYLESLGYDPGPADGRMSAAHQKRNSTLSARPRHPTDGHAHESVPVDEEPVLRLVAVEDRDGDRDLERLSHTLLRFPDLPGRNGRRFRPDYPETSSSPQLSPAEVYDPVKDNVWVANEVAGRTATDL